MPHSQEFIGLAIEYAEISVAHELRRRQSLQLRHSAELGIKAGLQEVGELTKIHLHCEKSRRQCEELLEQLLEADRKGEPE